MRWMLTHAMLPAGLTFHYPVEKEMLVQSRVSSVSVKYLLSPDHRFDSNTISELQIKVPEELECCRIDKAV